MDGFLTVCLMIWTRLGLRIGPISAIGLSLARTGKLLLMGIWKAIILPSFTLKPFTRVRRQMSPIMRPLVRICALAFPVDILEKLGDIPQEKWGEMENHGYDFVRILFPNISGVYRARTHPSGAAFPRTDT